MNKFSQILFILLALALASLVSLLTYRSLTKESADEQKGSPLATDTIVVAATDIARGSKIEKQNVRTQNFIRDSVPTGSFSSNEDVINRIAKQDLISSEPILESKLVSSDITKGGLAALVPERKRAMAVKVDQVIGVAGFLDVGHMVDVLVSIAREGEEKGYISKTVLENIKVLSAGSIEEEKDKEKKKMVNVITLEVTPEEAEKLALAVTQGKIQLALRSYADTVDALTRGATVTSLLKSYSSEEPVIFVNSSPEPAKVQEEVSRPSPVVHKNKRVLIVVNGNS
ncbi:MAG: Flp pilus assembly protein CpaB [Desulfobulbaceae bacterium]|nr:Flp pilus assembly protein CpaB [Desulfobulbaceae bacterium]